MDWRISLTFIQPYLDEGHTIFIGNIYTTPRLASYLLQRSTKVVSSIRPSGKDYLKTFLHMPTFKMQVQYSKNIMECYI